MLNESQKRQVLNITVGRKGVIPYEKKLTVWTINLKIEYFYCKMISTIHWKEKL